MADTRSHLLYCNEATPEGSSLPSGPVSHRLAYQKSPTGAPNITLSIPAFVQSVNHLPARLLDLLEIGAYVFTADRLIRRGTKDAVEFNRWQRNLTYVIRVRDHDFWNSAPVKQALQEALVWATGDSKQDFIFVPGHRTPATSLFDDPAFELQPEEGLKVALFSGGIDSLAGAAEFLHSSEGKLCLVSHRSSADAKRTQRTLLEALSTRYPARVLRYPITCHLKGDRAEEETQRSRSFLFATIAFAIARTYNLDHFYVFENGVTSMNLPKREGMDHARASRTTHPRTIALYEQLLSLVAEESFEIRTPYFWLTKTDVVGRLASSPCQDLLDSSVSCTRTFRNRVGASHCGGCSQCVDRRFAALGNEIDHAGLYGYDFVSQGTDDREAKMFLLDFIAHAKDCTVLSADGFISKFTYELALAEDYVRKAPGCDALEALYELHHRHGEQVMRSIRGTVYEQSDPTSPVVPGSLTDVVNQREYLKSPPELLLQDIEQRLLRGIPLMYSTTKCQNENDLNDKIDGIFNAESPRLSREYPTVSFGRAKVTPDHTDHESGILYEGKFVRKGTSPSKASEGIAADLTKYPASSFKLFVVYDPERAIKDDLEFAQAFERNGRCRVLIVR